MKTIYKYRFSSQIQMPHDAQILRVEYQGDELYMWALVHKNHAMATRYFLILPTGHVDIPPEIKMKYINTCFQKTGHVWHFFEVDPNQFESLRENMNNQNLEVNDEQDENTE